MGLGYALAGAVAGAGKGMLEMSQRKREDALAELEREQELADAERDRGWQEEDRDLGFDHDRGMQEDRQGHDIGMQEDSQEFSERDREDSQEYGTSEREAAEADQIERERREQEREDEIFGRDGGERELVDAPEDADLPPGSKVWAVINPDTGEAEYIEGPDGGYLTDDEWAPDDDDSSSTSSDDDEEKLEAVADEIEGFITEREMDDAKRSRMSALMEGRVLDLIESGVDPHSAVIQAQDEIDANIVDGEWNGKIGALTETPAADAPASDAPPTPEELEAAAAAAAPANPSGELSDDEWARAWSAMPPADRALFLR